METRAERKGQPPEPDAPAVPSPHEADELDPERDAGFDEDDLELDEDVTGEEAKRADGA